MYSFGGERGKKMFEKNSTQFVPALAGDCVAAIVQMGRYISSALSKRKSGIARGCGAGVSPATGGRDGRTTMQRNPNFLP